MVIAEIELSAFLRILKGSSLELPITERCLANKQLNNSTSLKRLKNEVRRNTRNFLLFNNVYNIDQ